MTEQMTSSTTCSKRASESIVMKLAVLSISLILTSGQAINGALPQIRAALGLSQTTVELLSTLPSITVILFILLSSYVARKIGLKRTITLGILLAGIGGSIPVVLNSVIALFVGRIILGAGLGLFNSLAVTIINRLYHGSDAEATLLGIRNSMEGIGQSLLTVIAGLLLNVSWNFSFAIYFLAFPIALFFYWVVPNIEDEAEEGHAQTSMPIMVYVLTAFAILLVCNGISVGVRFPSLAAEIYGDQFNASNYLAMMPIIGIIAGFLFGKIYRRLGIATLYVGLIIFAISNFLIGFASGNFYVLLSGVLLSSIPGTWCFPFIFMTLGQITTKNNLAMANSLIFIGCNIGGFIVPFVMNGLQFLSPSSQLSAPFPMYGALLLLIAIGLVIARKRIK
ncbi:MAG: MFS transporter [Aerococcus sp.]|nr:MFS transporter [Aerococcus sp.]